MSGNIVDWVASKIDPKEGLSVIGRTPEDFLMMEYRGGLHFPVAVIGVRDVILVHHVQPLFSYVTKPQIVVNVPSKTLWSGEVISLIHAAPAAFGTLGDVRRAASTGDVPSFRNKNWDFFERGIRQHSKVREVSRIFDEVFDAKLKNGTTRRIALVEGYHVSAEDIRNARDRFGKFEIAVKKTSYGSITDAADIAAESMGAIVVTFKGLLQSLAR
ncbi:hypothetical protein [Parasphingorhabdus sp.]|uniref:hypothetical protein n=1 Tax=Parasphingorhabdus sp. TaxID=2709688 RepID=UPI003A9264ED